MWKIRDELIFKAPATLSDVNNLHDALNSLVYRDGGRPILLDFLRYLAVRCRKVYANPPYPSEVRCLSMELRYAIQHGTDTEKEMRDTVQDLGAELRKLPEAERERVMPYKDAWDCVEVKRFEKWSKTMEALPVMLQYERDKVPFHIIQKIWTERSALNLSTRMMMTRMPARMQDLWLHVSRAWFKPSSTFEPRSTTLLKTTHVLKV